MNDCNCVKSATGILMIRDGVLDGDADDTPDRIRSRADLNQSDSHVDVHSQQLKVWLHQYCPPCTICMIQYVLLPKMPASQLHEVHLPMSMWITRQWYWLFTNGSTSVSVQAYESGDTVSLHLTHANSATAMHIKLVCITKTGRLSIWTINIIQIRQKSSPQQKKRRMQTSTTRPAVFSACSFY